MSDENNYTIWHFLKKCHERGWIYRGHDVMPWCPRCGTGISEHEIVTEGYQERTHLSVYRRVSRCSIEPNASLLVWTTTPWTLAANVAAAVHPELTYVRVEQDGETYYVAKDAGQDRARAASYEITRRAQGRGPGRPAYTARSTNCRRKQDVEHRVIAWDDVSAAEGTGIVHIAPGAARRTSRSRKQTTCRSIAPLDEFGVYVDGFDWLTGQYVHDVADADHARTSKRRGCSIAAEQYTHRYPVCWRCNTELVFRLVDEWFIAHGRAARSR